MATILQPIDFTDSDSKSNVKLIGADYTVGTDNVYLYEGDEFYYTLLREYGIALDDARLSSPPIYTVKKAMVCYVETLIFRNLIDDARAPFETQEILVDKFASKLKNAQTCLAKWLDKIDENAFFDEAKGTDSPMVGTFGRR
jgi:hypothetical protein